MRLERKQSESDDDTNSRRTRGAAPSFSLEKTYLVLRMLDIAAVSIRRCPDYGGPDTEPDNASGVSPINV